MVNFSEYFKLNAKVRGYRITGVLGSGSYGQVFSVTNGREQLAMKVPKKTEQNKKFAFEIETMLLLCKVDTTNLLRIHSSTEYYYWVIILTELLDMDCRALMMKHPKGVPIKTMNQIISGSAAGLASLNQLLMIHRDIKPENIMLKLRGDTFIPKIGDFGFLVLVKEVIGWAGTWIYSSPEYLAGQKPTMKTDCWSLGVTVAEMTMAIHPYARPYPRNNNALLEKIEIDIGNDTVSSKFYDKLTLLMEERAHETEDSELQNVVWMHAILRLLRPNPHLRTLAVELVSEMRQLLS